MKFRGRIPPEPSRFSRFMDAVLSDAKFYQVWKPMHWFFPTSIMVGLIAAVPYLCWYALSLRR